MTERYVSSQEAADMLGRTLAIVQGYCKNGVLRSVMVGHSLRIPISEVERLIAERSRSDYSDVTPKAYRDTLGAWWYVDNGNYGCIVWRQMPDSRSYVMNDIMGRDRRVNDVRHMQYTLDRLANTQKGWKCYELPEFGAEAVSGIAY